jgi:pyrroloquinoline quinone biosynthesis protein D
MKFYRNPEAMWREEDSPREEAEKGLEEGGDVSHVGTSLIMLHGKMHTFNILGTEIWKLCDGRTPDEIASELEKGFDVERAVLMKDVEMFLTDLKKMGLVYAE